MDDKTLDVANAEDLTAKVSDVVILGNVDAFQLLCKASSVSQGWMKSTKVLTIDGVGCLVQVTTQQKNADGSYAVAEALTFVPGVKFEADYVGGQIVKIPLEQTMAALLEAKAFAEKHSASFDALCHAPNAPNPSTKR